VLVGSRPNVQLIKRTKVALAVLAGAAEAPGQDCAGLAFATLRYNRKLGIARAVTMGETIAFVMIWLGYAGRVP
jgi:hypothetical protein